MRKLNPIIEKQLLPAMKAIRVIGMSATSRSIYKTSVIIESRKIECKRNMRIAEFVQSVSPTRTRNEWYGVALLKDVGEYYAEGGTSPTLLAVDLLIKAGYKSDEAAVLLQIEKGLPDSNWSDLALAISYADAHIDGNAKALTWESCCSEKKLLGRTDKDCRYCMMLKYALEKKGLLIDYDKALMKIKYDDALMDTLGDDDGEAEGQTESVYGNA